MKKLKKIISLALCVLLLITSECDISINGDKDSIYTDSNRTTILYENVSSLILN